jgi:hypothetical protein
MRTGKAISMFLMAFLLVALALWLLRGCKWPPEAVATAIFLAKVDEASSNTAARVVLIETRAYEGTFVPGHLRRKYCTVTNQGNILFKSQNYNSVVSIQRSNTVAKIECAICRDQILAARTSTAAGDNKLEDELLRYLWNAFPSFKLQHGNP